MAKFNPSIDLSAISGQFQGLRGRHPGLWPLVPRSALLVFILAALMALAWVGYWSGQIDELEAGQEREAKLKMEYLDKLRQAVNLDALRKQKEQVSVFVNQLEKQLPSKAEMDALLSDINQAGLGRSLQFDLFRPGLVNVREYYAELPIALKVTGRFHDIGAFTADVANLSRIVTLNNLSITPARDGALTLDATARTFRYLDLDEVAAQRKAAKPGAKK